MVSSPFGGSPIDMGMRYLSIYIVYLSTIREFVRGVRCIREFVRGVRCRRQRCSNFKDLGVADYGGALCRHETGMRTRAWDAHTSMGCAHEHGMRTRAWEYGLGA